MVMHNFIKYHVCVLCHEKKIQVIEIEWKMVFELTNKEAPSIQMKINIHAHTHNEIN